jgi:nitrogen fixation NifU-like protein
MVQNLDKFAQDLQKFILEEARKIYSEKVIEAFMQPKNVGRMNDPDGAAVVKGLCGDPMEIYLAINDDKIAKALFFTDGCGPTVACGSITTELAKGRTIKEALKISPSNVIDALDGLPEESFSLRNSCSKYLTQGACILSIKKK